MFSSIDRQSIARLEAKVDICLTRLGMVESKQTTHEAVCNERDKTFEEYRNRKEKEQVHSVEEWEDFREESNKDRQRIRNEIWESSNKLLWKIIFAMGVLLGATASVSWALITHRVVLP